MKDNISLVLAAIIGTILIVILPLYSILDRQDSMSYNVVLTFTTQFADDVRNKGFIDKQSYQNYVSQLAATGNTYKIEMEAYRKVLIHETDENGDIVQDSYVQDVKMDNTKDILEAISADTLNEKQLENSNEKNEVYLFNEGDELYVKVYNTNITSGSIIYSFIAGNSNSKVIDISYGGVINKINWELYEKLQAVNEVVPEVIMGIPENLKGSSNIEEVNKYGDEVVGKTCQMEPVMVYDELQEQEFCYDVYNVIGKDYRYAYDLTKEEEGELVNRHIKVSVALKNFADIYSIPMEKIADISNEEFKNIMDQYVQLNGMYAQKSYELRKEEGDYYTLNIILDNVKMEASDVITELASISILPGLGSSEESISSLGAETIQIELTDVDAIHTVRISDPYLFESVLKRKAIDDVSRIKNGVVYTGVEVAYRIQYTGIARDITEIAQAIEQNIQIHSDELIVNDFEILYSGNVGKYEGLKIPFNTILVKFKYMLSPITSTAFYEENYVELPSGWISTGLTEEDVPEGEEVIADAAGAKTEVYNVFVDDEAPEKPTLVFEGELGENDWYIGPVNLTLLFAKTDYVKDMTGEVIIGGSGVSRNVYRINDDEEQEANEGIIENEGTTKVQAFAYDYAKNMSSTPAHNIKIDSVAPEVPTITLEGPKADDTSEWYTGSVKVHIVPGKDETSKMARLEYMLTGQAATDGEWQSLEINAIDTVVDVNAEGESAISVRGIDNAGNISLETTAEVKIDTSVPPEANISVIEGTKGTNDWYKSDVKLKIDIIVEGASGFKQAAYTISKEGEQAAVPQIFTDLTKEFVITTSGIYTVNVDVYNTAGRKSTKTMEIKIDKDKPNAPVLEIVSGTKGTNDWYKTNTKFKLNTAEDVGPSGNLQVQYKVHDEDTWQDYNGEVTLTSGQYSITSRAIDAAGNNKESSIEQIKVDTVAPTPASINVDGTLGENGWYISDVDISSSGGQDNTSGIKEVRLSNTRITEDTTGIEVIATTVDNAGNESTSSKTIKIDKTKPEQPTIELSTPTGSGILGVGLYNQDVNVKITGGIDATSHTDRTNYTVKKQINGDNYTTIRTGTGDDIFNITDSGVIIITVTTKDNAGNSIMVSKNIWIDRSVPEAPEIISINGEATTGESASVTGTSSNLVLGVSELEQGEEVKVTLINEAQHLSKQYTSLNITLTEKATYSIQIAKINKFGTNSPNSTKLRTYIYR